MSELSWDREDIMSKSHTENVAMLCPACEVEMNRHAVKPSEPRNPEELAYLDPALDGVVTEVYSCPECGRSGSPARR